MIEKLSYSIKEAAVVTGIGRTKLYELNKAGELPFRKIGTRTLVRRADLERLLDRNIISIAA